jgi:isopropylmalate/homocitrate/citramalate synthase
VPGTEPQEGGGTLTAMDVTICDVGPRDGLQNEPETLEPSLRADLVGRLAAAGLKRIEAASFVRPDRVPQMAGAEEVVAAIDRADGVEYSGLVLNEEGYERLLATPLDRVNCTLAATESFNRRNANASLDEALARTLAILEGSERPTTVTLSVAFGCPFEGPVDPGVVADLAARLAGAADEVVLADTIGVATPRQVRSLADRVQPAGVHLHNTRNTGLANAYAALEAGVRLFDASVGGLGGCPFAPRATGNVATEDLVYLLEGDGVETGIDLDALISTAAWLEDLLGRELPGQVYRAGGFPSRTTPASESSATSSSA